MANWNETLASFTKVTDKLGKKIDQRILETVVALNMLGIVTRQSCEGHLGWGCPYPWIDISDMQQKPLLYRYLSQFYADKRVDFDSVLVLDGCRIRPHGGVVSEWLSEAEQQEKLSVYQTEMAAFTNFLKSLLNDDQEIGTFTLFEIPTKVEAPEA